MQTCIIISVLFRIKSVFQHQAERMVDRKVEFLDLVSLLLRYDDRDICDLCKFSAGLSCESDHFHSLLLCSHCGIHHIFRVSGGTDPEEHIPCFSIAVYLLGIGKHPVHIICECGGKRCMVCERDGRKSALEFLREFRSPFRVCLF